MKKIIIIAVVLGIAGAVAAIVAAVLGVAGAVAAILRRRRAAN